MAARADWIDKREAQAASANGNRNMSQMHFARQGIITEEMEYIAKREHLEPELIRSEVARGAASFPPTSITVIWSRWPSASPPNAKSTPTSVTPLPAPTLTRS